MQNIFLYPIALIRIGNTGIERCQSICSGLSHTNCRWKGSGYDEEAAWYIGAILDYEAVQNDWMLLLFDGKGDCLASWVTLEYMCRHMGVKARACGNIDYHGQTLIKAEGKYYIITTGYEKQDQDTKDVYFVCIKNLFKNKTILILCKSMVICRKI